MSVINQTLRALDTRGTPAQPQVTLRPVVAPARSRPVWWLAGVGVLLAAGAAAWWVARPTVTPVAPPAPRVAPVAMAAPEATPVAPVETAPPPAVPDEAVPPETIAPPALPVDPAPLAAVPPAAASPVAPTAVVSAVVEPAQPAPIPAPPLIQKRDASPSPEAAAEAHYRKAVALLQKDRGLQARPLLEEALVLQPGHVGARQTLVAVLSEAGRLTDAETVLRAGRRASPEHAWFAFSLAQLLAARGDYASAAATLQGGLTGRGVDADYHATLAAVLVQLERHPEAARHYREALALRPGEARWWVGLGMALAAQGSAQDARAAYQRALDSGTLPDNLARFVRAALQTR
ncbi:MAG: tetratricopeptide repeat protein [Gammaproteobacteria bacterium]